MNFSRIFGLGIGKKLSITPNLTITPSRLLRCRAEEQARQNAEKRRLMYVAFTRARDHVVLSGNLPFYEPGRPRRTEDNSNWLEILKKFKRAKAEWLHLIPVENYLGNFTKAKPPAIIAPPENLEQHLERVQKAPTFSGGSSVCSVTYLQDFQICPRRSWYRWEVGLESAPEAPDSDTLFRETYDFMSLGNLAHYLLEVVEIEKYNNLSPQERQPYLRMLSNFVSYNLPRDLVNEVVEQIDRALSGKLNHWLSDKNRSRREKGIMLHINPDKEDQHTSPPSDLFIGGRPDLIVDSSNQICVIEYTYSSPKKDISQYLFQLICYALAFHYSENSRNRTYKLGVLFLKPPGPRLHFYQKLFTLQDLKKMELQLEQLASKLVTSKQTGVWPKLEQGNNIQLCQKIKCPYLKMCFQKL